MDAALAAVRAPLDRHTGKALLLLDRAEGRCDAAKRAPARRALRTSRRRLRLVGKVLRTIVLRRKVPADVVDPIAHAAAALRTDVGTLASRLACP